jgi:hypothetical protein
MVGTDIIGMLQHVRLSKRTWLSPAWMFWWFASQLKVKLSRNRPWRPIGLWDIEDPTLSRQSAHRWRHGCQPYTPADHYCPVTSLLSFWYSFLLEAEWTPGPSAAGRIRQIEKNHSPHRVSNPRSSSLWHSTLTIMQPCTPFFYIQSLKISKKYDQLISTDTIDMSDSRNWLG